MISLKLGWHAACNMSIRSRSANVPSIKFSLWPVGGVPPGSVVVLASVQLGIGGGSCSDAGTADAQDSVGVSHDIMQLIRVTRKCGMTRNGRMERTDQASGGTFENGVVTTKLKTCVC